MESATVRLFLDQGRFKAGSKITIPRLDPPFVKGEILSADSGVLHPIQLADFAAFSLNRMQLLLGRPNLNARDAQLLQVLSSVVWNYRNIEAREVRADQWPPFTEGELAAIMDGPEKGSH